MRLILTADLAIPVVERLVLLQEDLDEPFHHLNVDVHWVPADRIRLGVHVWTDAPDEAVLRYREALRTISRSISALSFETCGMRFAPSEEMAQYVMAGVQDDADTLGALHRRVQRASEDLGGARATRPWAPLTAIGRLRTAGAPPLLSGVLRPYSETSFGATRCTELALYRADLVRGAEQIRQVERFELAAG